MRTTLLLIGLVTIIIIVGFLDSPDHLSEDETNHFFYSDDIAENVFTTGPDSEVPTFSSLEYIHEETKETNGYVVEVYREYEIYRDENDVIIKREPTSNYNYLRYKLDED